MRLITSDKLRNIYKSKFARDSFWAVFGNGLGNGLLLVAGILIARYLGRDLYGEYGIVKTNMFYMAGFSTFGLVYSSTRYIAKYLNEDRTRVTNVIWTCTKIAFLFSLSIGLCIAIFSRQIESLLGTNGLSDVLRALSVIIIIKAMGSTGTGILAGLGCFKAIAKGTVISGVFMLLLCVPLTYHCGLNGALTALLVSQIIQCGYNYGIIYKETKLLPIYYKNEESIRDLLKFSFPIALQEISYSICNWAGIILLTRYSSIGEVGLYTASNQWNAIILMLPGLLSNVVLSHLSSSNGENQKKLVSRLLIVYLICSAIPLAIIYLFIPLIISFYGVQFKAMSIVMQVTLLCTLPECCSTVLKSELIALGKTWPLFIMRFTKDIILVGCAALFLFLYKGVDGAYYYGLSALISNVIFFSGCFILYKIYSSKNYTTQ